QILGGVRHLLRPDGARPLRWPDPRRAAGGARRAVQRTDLGAVGGAAVRRPAADRGPHRRAADLRAHAAHQPAARDLRAAAGAAGPRHRRSADRAADPRGVARDRRLPAPPYRVRAVGEIRAQRAVSEALSVRALGKRYGHLRALSDITFAADAGELVAVIGPN